MDVVEIVEKGLKGVQADIENLETKLAEQIKNAGYADSATVTEIKNATEAELQKMKERQDALEAKAGRLGGNPRKQSFKSKIMEGISENQEALNEFLKSGRPFSFETKAIITEADAYTNDVVQPDYVPGIKYDAERRVRVRQFLPQGTTNSNVISHIRESNFTDNTASNVNENTASGQNDFDLTETRTNVEKISAHFRVSKEALSDTAGLASHISLRGTEKYMNEEDAFILYDSTQGLTVTATDYTLDLYTGDTNAQNYDVVLQAVKQVRNSNYSPTGIMLSINDYFDMIQAKDADGRYIFPNEVIFGNAVPRVLGVPLIATNAINSTDGNDDDFLVADFPSLCTLFDREGMTVRFYEQDQDNAVKDLVTVQIMGRLAVPTYLSAAGRYGRFSTAVINAGNS